jgi:RNA polymerase sigma-70 factor (ECF subfamily)
MTSTSDPSSTCPEAALASIHREEWGRLLALLVSRTRRLDLVEDALAEAFARAAARWPMDGLPTNPSGWLYTTAHRHVIGQLRAEATAGRRAPLLAVRHDSAATNPACDGEHDDRLQLILLCCHPALSRESQSALSLRLVIGTSTEEIARLFLVSTSTMAARLTRAKKKIVTARIPLGFTAGGDLASRLDEVCRTIYLAFTAGYTPGIGPHLLRADLAGDAVHLASVLHQVAPDSPQVRALRTLLILQHSRRDARECDGRLVTLAEQDRSRWHHDEIQSGLGLAATLAPTRGYAEELRLQAVIAAEHSRAPTAGDTNWTAIVEHYERLEALTGSPIVRLNRAVAVAEATDPLAGLAILAGLEDTLGDNHRFAAVCGDLADRAGDLDLAVAAYEAAWELCANDAERDHLASRLRAVAMKRTP